MLWTTIAFKKTFAFLGKVLSLMLYFVLQISSYSRIHWSQMCLIIFLSVTCFTVGTIGMKAKRILQSQIHWKLAKLNPHIFSFIILFSLAQSTLWHHFSRQAYSVYRFERRNWEHYSSEYWEFNKTWKHPFRWDLSLYHPDVCVVICWDKQHRSSNERDFGAKLKLAKCTDNHLGSQFSSFLRIYIFLKKIFINLTYTRVVYIGKVLPSMKNIINECSVWQWSVRTP